MKQPKVGDWVLYRCSLVGDPSFTRLGEVAIVHGVPWGFQLTDGRSVSRSMILEVRPPTKEGA